MHGVFGEFALLLRMSAAAGTMSLWLRQPVLIAHIVIGFLIILAMGKGRVEAVVEELLLGSVTKHVLAESQCDVLVICHPREASDQSP